MRLLFLTTFFCLPFISSIAQELEKIILVSRAADEPPTKQGKSEYSIEFRKGDSNEFVATDYYINGKKKGLSEKTEIEKERVLKVTAWKSTQKKWFSLSDLSQEYQTVQSDKKDCFYKLAFEMPDEINVAVDSFKFCQGYIMTKSISTGGYHLKVTFVDKAGIKEVIEFSSDDVGQGKLNLLTYFYCYKILNNRIPKEIPQFEFFTESKLVQFICYYLKTIECEGFFYKEFIRKNPDRTAKDNRMLTGWNFIEYMKKREK